MTNHVKLWHKAIIKTTRHVRRYKEGPTVPVHTVTTKFYRFDQNNTGGSFRRDAAKGIGECVVIEAQSVSEAIGRAEEIGLYFDGVSSGMDCGCCGDRWYKPWHDDGTDALPDCEAFVHRYGGTTEHINPKTK